MKELQCLEVWGGNEPVETAVLTPGLEAWVYSRPCAGEGAGGDLHYMSSCAAGQITRMLVADVAGHGEAVAETAGQLRSLMRRYVNFHDQRKLITAMNQRFIPLAKAGCFATAVLLTYDADRRELSVCNAGHPLPLRYSAARKEWSAVTGGTGGEGMTNLPLGIEDVRYEQSPIELGGEDMVLCYTDGLIEARDDKGEMLGLGGVMKLLEGLEGEPGRLLGELARRVGELNEGNGGHDDVTFLLIRPDGRSRAPGFLRRLVAPIRYVAWVMGVYRAGKEG